MTRPAFDDFIKFLWGRSGKVHKTLSRESEFLMHLGPEEITYTPVSSGNPRRVKLNGLQRFFLRHKEVGSYSPRDYSEKSLNASYHLALLREFYRTDGTSKQCVAIQAGTDISVQPTNSLIGTAQISEPIFGDKVYQIRARAALPLLIRQAQAGVPIYYSDLAEELGMPNPRNLNYVLGSIGRTLEILAEDWSTKIPPLQCIVLNKKTGLPGEGISWFIIKRETFSGLSLRQQRALIEAELQHVFSYPEWDAVLASLGLSPIVSDFSSSLRGVNIGFGGGESEEHKRLKEYVSQNPMVIGLSSSFCTGIPEYQLPSGDSLDVSFRNASCWVAAEVKSSKSPEPDIIRGLFQCIKYRSVMEAVLLTEASSINARALLVLESTFPKSLIPLRNLLGVEVIENIIPV